MKSFKVLKGFEDLNGNKFSTWSELTKEVFTKLRIYGKIENLPNPVEVTKEKITFPFRYKNVTVFERTFQEGEGKVIFDRKTGKPIIEAEFINEDYLDHLIENLEIYYEES